MKNSKKLLTLLVLATLSLNVTTISATFIEDCNDPENIYKPEIEKPEIEKPVWPDCEFPNITWPDCEKPPKECITHIPYIVGYEDGTFRGENAVTREEFSTMIARLMLDGEEPVDQASFTDVHPNRYSNKYIGYLEKMGMVSGYPDGTFRPYEPITRGEMAAMMAKLEQIRNEAIEPRTLSVPIPEKYLTRTEAVLSLNEMFDRDCDDVKISNPFSDLQEGDWAYEDILYATVEHTHLIK